MVTRGIPARFDSTRFGLSSPLNKSIRLPTIVYAENADQIGRGQAEKDTPFADVEAQFARMALQVFHVAMTCCCVAYKGRIDACLYNPIQTRQVAYRSRAQIQAPCCLPPPTCLEPETSDYLARPRG
jgi:hypothetical protein